MTGGTFRFFSRSGNPGLPGLALGGFCCIAWLAEAAVGQPQTTGTGDGSAGAVARLVTPQEPAAGEQHVATGSAPVSMEFLLNGKEPTSLEQLKAMQQPVRDIAKRVFAATVNIQVANAQGTGVIVSEDGYVLTAAHVIGRPNHPAKVVLQDGTKLDATALGVNRDVDSGMLKIELPKDFSRKLPWVELGQSGELPTGSWVVAVGHPGGLDPKRGMVVRFGRLLLSNPTMMRSECTLVGGDSGGPLIDMQGNLVGIHSRIGANLWDNIHVPIDTFSEDWDRLLDGEIIGGGSDVPFVGLDLKKDSTEIEKVEAHEAAARAGLKSGDRILKIDDQAVSAEGDVGKSIRKLKVGQSVDFRILRDGQEMSIKVKIGKR